MRLNDLLANQSHHAGEADKRWIASQPEIHHTGAMKTLFDFEKCAELLEEVGSLQSDLLEWLPERRGCLRALNATQEFFARHPEVEMVGLDVVDHGITGRLAGTDGSWMEHAGDAALSMEGLSEHLERYFLGRPTKSVAFCLHTALNPDPAGDFDYVLSRNGVMEALERTVGQEIMGMLDTPSAGSSARKSPSPGR